MALLKDFFRTPHVATTVDCLDAAAPLLFGLSIAEAQTMQCSPTCVTVAVVFLCAGLVLALAYLIGVLIAEDLTRLLPAVVTWVGGAALLLTPQFSEHPIPVFAIGVAVIITLALVSLRTWKHRLKVPLAGS